MPIYKQPAKIGHAPAFVFFFHEEPERARKKPSDDSPNGWYCSSRLWESMEMYEAVGAVSFMRMFYDQSETWAWDAFHVPGWAYNKKSPGAIIVVPYLEHLEQYCESQEVAMKKLEDQLA